MTHTFNDLCNGCSACVAHCPTDAIHGLFQERYDVDGRLCIDCSVCGWICARDAVLDPVGQLVPHLKQSDRPRPLVDPVACNGCRLCVDICSTNAFAIVGPVFRGVAVLSQPRACIACGDCATICIKGAIEMGRLNLRKYDAAEQTTWLLEYLDECG